MLDVFQIHEPASVQEASEMLATYGSDAAVYAGGTELLVIMKERLAHFPHLVNVKTIPGLNAIAIDGDALIIGALATHRTVERSPLVREHIPLLAELESRIANIRVRSTGTLGGNLCFAEPHSDPATLLIALDAVLTLSRASGSRTLPLEHFFVGLLETAREPEEILIEIRIPIPAPPGLAYERFKIHERPTATVAAAVWLDGAIMVDARIVVGSVCDRPTRVLDAEQALIGERPAIAIATAAEIVHDAIEPTIDAFESVDYKRQLARTLTARALTAAAERASGDRHDR